MLMIFKSNTYQKDLFYMPNEFVYRKTISGSLLTTTEQQNLLTRIFGPF